MRYVHKWHTPIVIRIWPDGESEFIYFAPMYNPKLLPVVNTMRDEYGRSHSACRWMENFDGFWTQQHGARGFSL